MELESAAQTLSTLGHPGRLSVLRLLARRAPEGVPATQIAHALGLKPNTLSVYVGALERAGLVTAQRQGTSILYRIDLSGVGALVDFLVADCCRGRPDLCAPQAAQALTPGDFAAKDSAYNVLFICAGNSARSIFAEALLRDLGGARFTVYSAGTRPGAGPNPYAIELLQKNGHQTAGLRSKDLRDYQGAQAPQMDFVFTVCDTAANEDCPPWPGQPVTGHWGLPDPVKVEGTRAEKALAFAQAYGAMRRRVQAFAALPLTQLDRLSLQARVDDISRMDDTQTV